MYYGVPLLDLVFFGKLRVLMEKKYFIVLLAIMLVVEVVVRLGRLHQHHPRHRRVIREGLLAGHVRLPVDRDRRPVPTAAILGVKPAITGLAVLRTVGRRTAGRRMAAAGAVRVQAM